MIERLRGQPVGGDHRRDRRRLHRDLHVVEVDLFEVRQLQARRLDERLGGRAAEAFVDVGVQGSRRSRRCGSARRGRAPREATSLISSGLRRFPGLSRRPCTPASRAASAISTWKWMSATIGTGERGHDLGQAFGGRDVRCRCSARCRRPRRPARRSVGACLRRRPSWSSSSTGPRWARRRPTLTEPTAIWRVFRRGAEGAGGDVHSSSLPRSAGSEALTEGIGDRVGDVEVERAGEEHQQHAHEGVDERCQTC